MLTVLEVLREYVAALGMALTGFGGFTGLLSLSVNRQQLGSCTRTFRQAVRGANLPGISPEVMCSAFFIKKRTNAFILRGVSLHLHNAALTCQQSHRVYAPQHVARESFTVWKEPHWNTHKAEHRKTHKFFMGIYTCVFLNKYIYIYVYTHNAELPSLILLGCKACFFSFRFQTVLVRLSRAANTKKVVS